MTELENVMGGANSKYSGCIITNGKCSSEGGCGVCNGKCRDTEEPVESEDVALEEP